MVAIPTARAQPRPEPSAAERETARSLLDRGQDKQGRGDLDGAIEDYRAAHAIMGVPSTAAFLAEAQLLRGRLIDALDTASSVERMPVVPGEPPQFTDARLRARRIAEDALRRTPTLHLTVLGPAADADLRVAANGAAVRKEAISSLRLDPGRYRIDVAAQGFAPQQITVELPEGVAVPAVIQLIPDPDAPPLPPLADRPLDERGGSGSSLWPIVGFSALGVGGVLIGVGAVTGIMSASRTGDLEPQCQGGCPPDLAGELDSARSLATASTITWIAGAAVAAAGITILAVDATRGGEPAVALRLAPDGVHVGGRL